MTSFFNDFIDGQNFGLRSRYGSCKNSARGYLAQEQCDIDKVAQLGAIDKRY